MRTGILSDNYTRSVAPELFPTTVRLHSNLNQKPIPHKGRKRRARPVRMARFPYLDHYSFAKQLAGSNAHMVHAQFGENLSAAMAAVQYQHLLTIP